MTNAELLISVQRALLGNVPASLRLVTCGWEGTEIKLSFVFDGEIDDDIRDDVGAVGAEVVSDFPAPWTISEEILQIDSPESVLPAALNLWAFHRKEPLPLPADLRPIGKRG